MQFKDLPEYAKQAACNALSEKVIKNPYDKGVAKGIRDAFIALYSEAENAGAYENLKSAAEDTAGSIFSKRYSEHGEYTGNIHSNCAAQSTGDKEAESAKEDFELYINGGYIPLIVERRAMLEIGDVPILSIYHQQVRYTLQLAKALHAKKDENGNLTEADFYDANKTIFQLASALNQMQKREGVNRRVEDSQ
ncbi:hypothetical protein FOT62_13700 [Serratia marcescens]|uniref:Uncharacterized protein n=1 Tax=Serratia marcescens TaxID=615 RepID=A0A5C7CK53_SERMA|nr:hypothetical protein [Serratia marcescens]TXE33225.1 hypothetical protein FOT62_13700 [Serratia marcescens]TXE65251.1 hypothetical protein FOT56_08675 [Serratia marcescens]